MSFRTKKSLGQHFLTDNNIVFKIIEAVRASPEDRVIEIGPGTGALTKSLHHSFNDLQVIEIDQRAIKVLERDLPDLIIHEMDVLKVNWPDLVSKSNQTYVIGNLPYYITSPILFGLLEKREHITEVVLMMQKEVAQRLIAQPSTKDYGILSVQTQLMCSPEILFDVSPNSFSPPPKVMSSVVRLTFDKGPLPCSDEALKTVVRTAFNQRRKKISNSLKPVLGDFQPEGYNFDQRAENWTPDIYAKLAELLEKTDRLAQ